MIPPPHGGRLVRRLIPQGQGKERLAGCVAEVALSRERALDVENLATGVFSPLDGFMGREQLEAVAETGRLPSGVPWTIPIVLDVRDTRTRRWGPGDHLALVHEGVPIAVLEVTETYRFDREALAARVFGTTDPKHPGVARVATMGDTLVAGPVDLLREVTTPYARFKLTPRDTRVLFEVKGWRTVVGFQTRNVPHLGHEYVQKTALTFADGLFVNPLLGPKKPGDFADEVILAAYEALLKNYYLRDRAVLAVLETEMRYAGPREAVFHAIMRKNFGCTHFIVGRDHAGVGNYYPPYAAQEIFDRFPDLGIAPLFFTAFFYCRRCEAVANEKTCPHPAEHRLDFSGTALRAALVERRPLPREFVRPEVMEVLLNHPSPFNE